MAEITYSKLVDGQPLDAASLNDRFTVGGGSLQGAINDLTEDATSPGTFNNNHLPSLFIAQGNVSVGTATNTHSYAYSAVDYPNNITVVTRGGTDLAVEPSAGVTYNLTTGECKGVLVMADLYVHHIKDAASAAADRYFPLDGAVFLLQVRETPAGAWTVIDRSIRWVHSGFFNTGTSGTPCMSSRDHSYKVPIRALIRAGGDVSTFNAVRVMVSVLEDPASGGGRDVDVVLRECQLSALILRSGRS